MDKLVQSDEGVHTMRDFVQKIGNSKKKCLID